MTEHVPETDLVLTWSWEEVVQTSKYDRMLQRRAKFLQDMESYTRFLRVIEDILDGRVEKGETVVEIACGMGFHLLELSNRGWNVKGIEIDPHLCGLSGDAARRFGLQAHSIAGDACAIPLSDNSVSAVFSQSFFEHVYDVDLALDEQIRILKPGGLLVILDGNFLNPKLLLDLLVFYPLRTRGQHGGLKWLFTKGRVYENLYGYLKLGRDEDVKTPRWWKRRIGRESGLRLIQSGTGAHYTFPRFPSWLQTFLGNCLVIAKKERLERNVES